VCVCGCLTTQADSQRLTEGSQSVGCEHVLPSLFSEGQHRINASSHFTNRQTAHAPQQSSMSLTVVHVLPLTSKQLKSNDV